MKGNIFLLESNLSISFSYNLLSCQAYLGIPELHQLLTWTPITSPQSSKNSLTYSKISELISILSIDQMSIENEITNLNEEYYRNEHAFKIIETAQTYKLVTTSDNAEIYQKYAELEFNDHLSNSALETLTIIAYNQPITRFDIEEKRGVMASHNLKILMTRDLIKVTLEDAAAADDLFSVLMGEDVELRRSFIQRNAKDVRFLDI